MKKGHAPDYVLIFCAGFLILFGLVMLSSASSNLGQQDFNDPYYYLRHQIYFGLILGLAGYFLTSKIYYGFYKNAAVSTILLVGSVALLVAVFTPLGFSAGGATRWLNIGGITFQPGDLLKITLVIYLANWLSKNSDRQKNFLAGYIPFMIILGIISVLLLAQHSTSPVVILLIVGLVMYFLSGAKWRYVFGTVAIAALALALVVRFTEYRADRIFYFLNPEADPQGKGYQVIQAKTAIGSGGILGVGYGQSAIKTSLPEPIGDSIFAIIAEEFGFVGATLLITVIGALVMRLLLLAKQMRDKFGQLLLVGFGSIIALQSLINIGAMSGALPLTGTPLPFISYGGTALVVFMTMIGIAVNISKYS